PFGLPGVSDQRLEGEDGRLRRAKRPGAAALLADPPGAVVDGLGELSWIGAEPTQQRQRRRLDLQITAARTGDARLGAIDDAVRLLRFGDLLQKRNRLRSLGSIDQAVGDKSEEVRVLRRLRLLAECVHLALKVLARPTFG